MYHKEKVGDMEVVYPDKGMKNILSVVVDQNLLILSMNKKIVDILTTPPILQTEENN